ncbi:hypothetical protein [Vampirovibrio chlorellavorus]|uniref:hypothetical protein n=1 Tax=Vampirovibrio chlorellavorus TaxID=758823 RepID=UPI0026E93AD2|nr:hypothetical protein [Vampirovibrio chlorellavorus]
MLKDAHEAMNESAHLEETYFLTRGAQKLEDDLHKQLLLTAKGTSFENNIHLISGFRFPDIVARINESRGFGIEVKTTKKNDWKCIGNSVLESTREKGIERIYLFFGKLHPPVSFKYRLYQDCLPEVSVTHSPRYQIDMGLPPGQSIFDKMGISYDALQEGGETIKTIINYYKRIYGKERVWWITEDNEEEKALDFKIKILSEFPKPERARLLCQIMALFPIILIDSNEDNTKYYRASAWLLRQGITDPALRDKFSASGRKDIPIKDKVVNVPRVLFNLIKNLETIIEELHALDEESLKEAWDTETIGPNRLIDWINITTPLIQSNFKNKEADGRIFLEYFNEKCHEIKI